MNKIQKIGLIIVGDLAVEHQKAWDAMNEIIRKINELVDAYNKLSAPKPKGDK